MKRAGFFVTGTDTEVGKTIVTGLLARALRTRGEQVSALKPFATGSPGPGLDAEHLGNEAGHSPRTFVTFQAPASPERAALLEGTTIDVGEAVRWTLRHPGLLLVEGVGGLEVPLDRTHRVSDFARALGLPVIVVARNRLGVLNHTLLTVEAAKRAGLTVRAVVLNDADPAIFPSEWNEADLKSRVSSLVRLGHIAEGSEDQWASHLLRAIE